MLDICRQYRDKWLKAQTMSKKDRAYHVFYLWDNPEFRYRPQLTTQHMNSKAVMRCRELPFFQSVFRIRIGSGFRGVLDPDPDPGL